MSAPKRSAKAKTTGDALTAKIRKWLGAKADEKTIVCFSVEKQDDGSWVAVSLREHSLLRDPDWKLIYAAVAKRAMGETHASELDGTLGSKAEALAGKAADAFVDGVFTKLGSLFGGSSKPAGSPIVKA